MQENEREKEKGKEQKFATKSFIFSSLHRLVFQLHP